MNKHRLPLVCLSALLAFSVAAKSASADENNPDDIRLLQERVDQLEAIIAELPDFAAEYPLDSSPSVSQLHFGGYGELHYNHLNQAGRDIRLLDLHRMVLFVGYDFSETARFVSELEVEHVLVSAGARGAVELEQVYIELDLHESLQMQTGVLLMPLGIINESHEPPVFYGVERPVVEQTIIPTTWYAAGIKFAQHFSNGLSYDVMISEGLKTEDPTGNPGAEPFNLKKGKQKASFADAFDLAFTGRLVFRGVQGLELAAYTQYQPDLDQSAEVSYADEAILLGGHAIYQRGDLSSRLLYARWNVEGKAAEAAGKDIQEGGYAEFAWRANERWGIFVRQSAWSQTAGMDAQQTDLGLNYYPHPDIAFKVDYQLQNEDAGDSDGLNLGMGYQF